MGAARPLPAAGADAQGLSALARPGAAMDLLLLEDDADLGAAVAGHLRAAGHPTQWCRTVAQARAAAAPAMALIDLRLPDGCGLALLQQWRQQGDDWPVIVLTARDQVSDRIRGLQAGADDYLVKPFDLGELLARVHAVARRLAGPRRLVLGDLLLDLAQRCAWLQQQPVDLTHMEWVVLACLARRPGRIYSRSDIEDGLHRQGLGEATSSNSLEVIVSRLRRKLGGGLISTHRGLGYRLDA